MTSISLPDPVVRHGGPPPADAGELQRDLRRRVDGEVRFDAGSRAVYRVVGQVTAVPSRRGRPG